MSLNSKPNINETKIKSNLGNKKDFVKKNILKSREKSKELDRYKTMLKHSDKKPSNSKCLTYYGGYWNSRVVRYGYPAIHLSNNLWSCRCLKEALVS